jgi:hypothetical protein
MRGAFVAGWLLVGLLVPADLAQAQQRDNRKVKVEYLAELNGVAFCRDEGDSFAMIKVGLSAMQRQDTEAHERKHLEQHRRFKTCKDFDKYYKTPRGRLELEAEAFAAGWCVQVALGADPYSLRSYYLQTLMRHYVPGTQVYEVATAFARYQECK